ncbi:hypothetical protein RHGRI_017503 [Rhododendron griersonianum]|uniref:Uncharacterized protein n=1 Tax=Rhododendron griersonianum TaxID=479676 RepID=A0AAV6JY12_9ERIC|nr:hypothetical protein RHGRI_017503 [Rhododendron griersonianum]
MNNRYEPFWEDGFDEDVGEDADFGEGYGVRTLIDVKLVPQCLGLRKSTICVGISGLVTIRITAEAVMPMTVVVFAWKTLDLTVLMVDSETILLAFQNYILMLGTSGDKAQVIQTLLFVAGINTLLQALFGTVAALEILKRSTGAYKAASWLAIATPPPAYVLSRGIGRQGIGVMLDGLFGTGTCSIVSVENVGLHSPELEVTESSKFRLETNGGGLHRNLKDR